MESNDSCPTCFPLVDQVLKTLQEIERSGIEKGTNSRIQKEVAIENLRQVIKNHMFLPQSTDDENFNDESHMCDDVLLQEETLVIETQETPTPILAIEEKAPEPKSPDKIQEIVPADPIEITSLAPKLSQEQLDNRLFELVIGHCVVVYCTICNKQFKEKSFARQHILDAHFQSKKRTEKETEPEPESEPQENALKSNTDLELVSMTTSREENELFEGPQNTEHDKSIAMTTENREGKNEKNSMVMRLRRVRKGGGQILYQCLENRRIKKNSRSMSMSDSTTTGQQQSNQIEQTSNQVALLPNLSPTKTVQDAEPEDLFQKMKPNQSLLEDSPQGLETGRYEIAPSRKSKRKRNQSQNKEKSSIPIPISIPIPSSSSSSSPCQSSTSLKINQNQNTNVTRQLGFDEIGLTASFKNSPEELERAEKYLRMKNSKGMKKGSEIWECSKCENSLRGKHNALRHVLSVHFWKRVPCPKCSRPMANKPGFRKHVFTCSGPVKKVPVNFNNEKAKGTMDKKILEYLTPILIYSPWKPKCDRTVYECTLCKREFDLKSSASYHVKNHHFVPTESHCDDPSEISDAGPSRDSSVSSSDKMILKFDKPSLKKAMNARVTIKQIFLANIESLIPSNNNNNNNNNNDPEAEDGMELTDEESETHDDCSTETDETCSTETDDASSTATAEFVNVDSGNENMEEEKQPQDVSVTLDLEKIRSEMIFGKI